MNDQNKQSEVDPLIASGVMEIMDKDTEDGKAPEWQEPEAPATSAENTSLSEAQEAEGSAYWKDKYMAEKSQHDDLRQFEGIIGRLRTDDELIDVLEAHMAGDIVSRGGYEAFADIQDAPGQGAVPPQQQLTSADIKAAEERGAQQAVVQKQLQSFMANLAENGVPDHAQDKFMEFMNNPSGVTVHHLWSVFQDIEGLNVTADEGQNGQPAAPTKPRGTIASLPGSTDKPSPDRYLSEGAMHTGSNYVSDPNNL